MGPKSVRAWLFGSDDGKEILSGIREELKQDAEQAVMGRYACLVELRWDGAIKVWADKPVDVCVYHRPYVTQVDAWDEHLEAEEWGIDRIIRETILPRSYVYLFDTKPRRETGRETKSIFEVLAVAERLQWLAELRGEKVRLNGRKLRLVV